MSNENSMTERQMRMEKEKTPAAMKIFSPFVFVYERIFFITSFL